MLCGRCCVTEPPTKLALRLDIFIEILPRTWVNKPLVNAPDPTGWHHGCCCRTVEEEGRLARRKLLCRRQKRTRPWSAASWRRSPRVT
jgi:hypothetical protein